MKYHQLIQEIKQLYSKTLTQAIHSINQSLIIRNWFIGCHIVEYEQNGKDRAKYGDNLLQKISKDLRRGNNKQLSERYLEITRKFFLLYPIPKAISSKFITQESSTSLYLPNSEIIRNLQDDQYVKFLFANLSWSHFVELLRIKNEDTRSFYEIESIKNNWSIRELVRQKNSLLFERIGLSKNKSQVLEMAKKGAIIEKPQDLIREPYIFEFLGLDEKSDYSESDLETALIDHLQEFLFEMGKGFCFVARQYRITFSNKHYYVDLVLYNRFLKTLVLIDLKVNEFEPEYAGQMNFYLNYFKRNETISGEKEPIGIIMCASKERVMVEYAFGSIDNRIFTTEYKVILPSPDELQKEISEYQKKIIITREQTNEIFSCSESCETSNKQFRYPEDFSKTKWQNYIKLTKISNDLSTEELLCRLQLAKNSGNNLLFNDVGILFFARKPKKFLGSMGVVCYLIQGNTELQKKEFNKGFLQNISGVLNFVKKNTHSKFQHEILEEIIINMLFHKDYSFNSSAIVKISGQKIEFCNPISSPIPFDQKEIGQHSHIFNPTIGNLLFRINYVHKLGLGIQKINSKCQEQNIPLPIFTWNQSEFKVTLIGKEKTIEEKIKLTGPIRSRGLLMINYLQKNQTMTVQDYLELTQISIATAKRDLVVFQKEKIIHFVGAKKSGYYELKIQ